MNRVLEEMNDILMHYGTPKRSGRYPWGSGNDPNQHSRDFISRVEELEKQGITYVDEKTGKKYTGKTAIAKTLGMSSTDFRTEEALAKEERRMLNVETAKRLRDKEGLSPTEIGRKMGINESTARSYLNPNSESRMNQSKNTAKFIKNQVDKKGMIDVGSDVARELNISPEKLNQAIYLLKREGYPVYKGGVPQITNPGKQTNQRVICKPGTEHKEIYNYDKVHALNEDDYVSHDGGKTFDKFVYPKSMDSKRLMIRYADTPGKDGTTGLDKDGVVELRRGVKDISLGDSHYSQVRILVDGKKYIKGMAVYSDDMPDGVDVVFNTNKKSNVNKMDVLKDIKNDPDNPFGSLIKAKGQDYYEDKNGKKQLSLINKRAEEGDWNEWKNALPSQFLAKQSLPLVKKQLNLSKVDKLSEYDEICSNTNPTIKKHLLEKFADECDSSAVKLQAASLPGQRYHVIIPVNNLKDTEVYAPNYTNGTKLALIRYPHGGTFEIPILTVNNKNSSALKLLGNDIEDAIAINKKVADRLSGADFDGDTVMCIPTHDKNGKIKISSTPYLEQLVGFDPKTTYGASSIKKDSDGTEHLYDTNGNEYRKMKNTQKEMGVISNLITDMTLAGGANTNDISKAVKHSMVVIDAEKHKLNYKQSEIDNDIASLKRKYQTTIDENGNEHSGGASTLLSRSKGEVSVLKRQGSPYVNIKGKEGYNPYKPEGSLIYKTADDLTYEVTKVNKKTGVITKETKFRTQQSTRMMETDDAYSLVSSARNPKELAYAEYANSMKSLANNARKEMMATGKLKYNKEAHDNYLNEVNSLNSHLNNALLNTVKERSAQRKANAEVQSKIESNPELKKKKADVRKLNQQSLTKYRNEVGSVSRRDRSIKITDKEWEAIQKGAISENQLKKILNNTDIDDLRARSTPRTTTTLSVAKVNKIKSMSNSNYSLSEIAEALGVSTSTVSNYLKGA